MNALYFELVLRFEYRVMCSVLEFQLLCEQGTFAVTGDKIVVFAASSGEVSYSNLIYKRSSDNRCCF